MSKQMYNGFERMKRMFCPIRRIIAKFLFLIKKKEGAPPRLSKKEGRGTPKGSRKKGRDPQGCQISFLTPKSGSTLTFLPEKCQSVEFWQNIIFGEIPNL